MRWSCTRGSGAMRPEDVVQEAFLLLVRQVVAPDNPVGWMYRVVRNRAINAGAIARTAVAARDGGGRTRRAVV